MMFRAFKTALFLFGAAAQFWLAARHPREAQMYGSLGFMLLGLALINLYALVSKGQDDAGEEQG